MRRSRLIRTVWPIPSACACPPWSVCGPFWNTASRSTRGPPRADLGSAMASAQTLWVVTGQPGVAPGEGPARGRRRESVRRYLVLRELRQVAERVTESRRLGSEPATGHSVGSPPGHPCWRGLVPRASRSPGPRFPPPARTWIAVSTRRPPSIARATGSPGARSAAAFPPSSRCRRPGCRRARRWATGWSPSTRRVRAALPASPWRRPTRKDGRRAGAGGRAPHPAIPGGRADGDGSRRHGRARARERGYRRRREGARGRRGGRGPARPAAPAMPRVRARS